MLKFKIAAFMFAHALDIASTCTALARGNVERNPLLPNSCKGNALAQASISSVSGLGLISLHKSHPRLVTWIIIGSSALEVGIAAHNFSLQQSRR